MQVQSEPDRRSVLAGFGHGAEELVDGLGGDLDRVVGGFQAQVGRCRSLVGVVDAGEAGELAGSVALVQAFRVAACADVQWRRDVDL